MTQFLRKTVLVTLLAGIGNSGTMAQNRATDGPPGDAAVPRLVKFNGVLPGNPGTVARATVGVTFALYAEREGGSPLWQETQNVTPDEQGRYGVFLGAASAHGLPADLFTGEARWLGVRTELPGEVEQPRVLLVSVPYAMKAADAQTLGGRPASDYLLREQMTGWSGVLNAATSSSPTATTTQAASGTQAVVSGTVNFLGKFTPTGADLGNSQIFDNGTNVGIGTTTPAAQLDVNVVSSSNRNALNTNVTLVNSSAITNAVISALNMQLVDASTATNLSKQSARMVYIRHANATGAVSAFDSVFTTSAIIDSNALYQLRAMNLEGPSVAAGKTLGTFYGGYIGAPSGAGTVTNKFALVTEPGAGNVGFGTVSPVEALDVAGIVRASGGFRFGDGTLQTTAGGGGTVTAITAGSGLSGGTINSSGTISVDPTATQSRINGTCAVGSSIRVVNQDGSVTCQVDNTGGGAGDITDVIAGLGLTGGATSGPATLAIDTAVVPRLNAANVFTTGQTFTTGLFSGSSGMIVKATQSGSTTTPPDFATLPPSAVQGLSTATSNFAFGVIGLASSPDGVGLVGANQATTGDAVGVLGTSNSSTGTGVRADNGRTSGFTFGLVAEVDSPDGTAARAVANSTTGATVALDAEISSDSGVVARFMGNSTGGKLISGLAAPSPGTEVFQVNTQGNVRANSYLSLSGVSVALATNCSAGQLMKWTGSSWACSSDLTGGGGGGTVTSITAGTGLTGGTISTSGTIAFDTAFGDGRYAAANTAVPVYNSAGSLQASAHIVTGAVILNMAEATVNLAGSAAFTSSGTYNCTVTHGIQGNSPNTPVPAVVNYISGSQFIIKVDSGVASSPGMNYICVGN